jgi:hypothetical protein
MTLPILPHVERFLGFVSSKLLWCRFNVRGEASGVVACAV